MLRSLMFCAGLLLPFSVFANSIALTGTAVPPALMAQTERLGELLRDPWASVPPKSVRAQLVPEYNLALVVFSVTGWGGGNNFTDHLAVFHTVPADNGQIRYMLADTLEIGGKGLRSVDTLHASVQTGKDSDSLLIYVPAKANQPGDASNFPSKPVTLTFRLQNQRLTLLAPKKPPEQTR